MKSGSITIFFSMIVTLLLSLFFSMSETIRIVEMNNHSGTITQEALQSAFSEYQRYLWDEYGVLALDAGYGGIAEGTSLVQEKLAEYCWENCNDVEDGEKSGNDFFRLALESCNITEYELLTDNNGEWFRYQGALAAKQQITEDLITQWAKSTQESTGNAVETKEIEQRVEDAKTAMETPKEEESSSQNTPTENMDNAEIPEVIQRDNPLEVFRQIKEEGWLGLVTENGISEKVMSLDGAVSVRKRNEGSRPADIQKTDLTDTLFYQWYLMNTFGRYGNTKGDRGLDYEVEYIINGKQSDRENLESVVEKVLALREGENLITILTTPSMLQQANQVAISLAGVSGNPALIQVVQGAVVAVWALVESILDVRSLLQGKKIPIIKNQSNWTSELYTLGAYLGSGYYAKEVENGISYEQYLNLFLTTLSQEKSGLRPMDLMENQLHRQEDYVEVKMDHMICSMQAQIVCVGNPIFLTFVSDISRNVDWYHYFNTKEIHY